MVIIIKKKYIIILLTILTIPLVLIRVIDNYFSPKTNEYIYNQTKVLVSNTFSSLLNESITPYLNDQELVKISYKDTSSVSGVILNTEVFNKILGKVYILLENTFQNNMDNFFKNLEIPIGSLVSKTIFAGRGHLIDIPIIPLGAYSVDLKTDCEVLGINSHLLEVYIEIKVVVETIIPFNPLTNEITSKFLLASHVIQGEVPNYYYASNSSESFPYIPST
jgi:sporulation protein YunB